jgi:hypothetical protein
LLKKLIILITVVMLLLLSVSVSALDTSAKLTWDPPTTNVDGTPCTDLAGYKAYVGLAPRSYTQTIDVGNATTYSITNLPEGTYYFAVTAYDTAGNESDYSNEVSKKISVEPSAPSGCKVQ